MSCCDPYAWNALFQFYCYYDLPIHWVWVEQIRLSGIHIEPHYGLYFHQATEVEKTLENLKISRHDIANHSQHGLRILIKKIDKAGTRQSEMPPFRFNLCYVPCVVN